MDLATFPLITSRSLLKSRAEVLGSPCPIPTAPGVYAWYFSQVPGGIDTTGCHEVDGLKLLYVGISPKAPPTNGKPPSRSTLRQRLRTHYSGNAEGSTLRLTLGCLLGDEIGVSLRRVGSGRRRTFTNPGEQLLDRWMDANAFVAWVPCERPWEVEGAVLAAGHVLPLNIQDNPSARHVAYLSGVRSAAARAAETQPILADSGGPRGSRLRVQEAP